MAVYETIDGFEKFEAWTVKGQMEAVDRIRVELLTGIETVVCEAFHISTGTAKKAQAGSLTTIEIIGAARWICYKRGVEFILQTPADAKSFCDNDKLRALGWWTRGADHSRDATRHLVLYLVRASIIPVQRVLASPTNMVPMM